MDVEHTTAEAQKNLTLDCFKRLDEGEAFLNRFAKNVQAYYSKWDTTSGRDEVGTAIHQRRTGCPRDEPRLLVLQELGRLSADEIWKIPFTASSTDGHKGSDAVDTYQ